MTRRNIMMTISDHSRLQSLLVSDFVQAIGPKSYLKDLRAELDRAVIVPSRKIPADVITMNSTVRLRDLETDERETYTLVYPEHADIAADKLSILAPIGTAILGYRVGDVVSWRVPSGSCQIEIEELLYQPEREQAVPL
jgi:regulator of nucleoside diphosphate kinase